MAKEINYTRILVEAAKAIGLSVVINVVLYYVLSAAGLLDTKYPITPDGQTLTVAPVVISTVMFMAIGTLIFLGLARFSGNPAGIFTWIAIIGFVLSLANPFLAKLPTQLAIGLDVLHIAPACLLWRFLTRAV